MLKSAVSLPEKNADIQSKVKKSRYSKSANPLFSCEMIITAGRCQFAIHVYTSSFNAVSDFVGP